MQTTAVATIPAVPAYLQQYVAQHADENAAAAGGIKAGSWPRISIGGSKFSIKQGGEKTLIADPNNPQLPKMQLELVVVGHNPGVSKTFYEGDYVEGSDAEPECSSDDGITPDDGVPKRQSAACATCPQNQWGSKISKMSNKQIKACSDSKRLVVLKSDDLDGDAYELSITAGALKDWANYVRELDKQRIPVSAVVTHVFFDPAATYPKMLFKFGGFLSAEQLAIVEERKDGDDVLLIASPRRTGGNVIPIQQAPPAPAPQPAAAAAQPAGPAPAAPAPAAPAPAPVVVDPYVGLGAHVKAAVEAVGGIGTEVGRSTYKALAGKDAPALPGNPAPATPVAPPPPPDPYAGQPPHVKQAVDGAGGLGTPAGDATYKALTQKDPPASAAAVAPAAPARRSRKAAATQPTPAVTPGPAQAPVGQTPPAAAAALATGFASAPAGSVASGGLDIEAMLKKALETPAA